MKYKSQVLPNWSEWLLKEPEYLAERTGNKYVNGEIFFVLNEKIGSFFQVIRHKYDSKLIGYLFDTGKPGTGVIFEYYNESTGSWDVAKPYMT
jgi:hypothetical protein